MSASAIDAYLNKHLSENLDKLARFVAQPSVGAQNLGIARGADFRVYSNSLC